MKVIMLVGDSNCGKTTTINMICDTFIANGAIEIEKKKYLQPDARDFTSLLNYHQQIIGICSLGDYASEVIKYFDVYEKKNADILICACNNRFVTPFERIKRYNHQIVYKTTFDEINKKDANKILSEFNITI